MFSVRANRAFLARTVRFLAGETGIRQFLDIGTGIPTANNTHEVAQRAAPDSRIVYVDNDPIVLSHARALLKSSPQGACAYLDADLRDPDAILAAAADTLDFGQPVAVMLIAVMHFIGDDAQASEIITQLTAACVPGSFVVISHVGGDIDAEQQTEMVRRLNESVAEKATMRDRAGVTRLFDGLELVTPAWSGSRTGGRTPTSRRPAPRSVGRRGRQAGFLVVCVRLGRPHLLAAQSRAPSLWLWLWLCRGNLMALPVGLPFPGPDRGISQGCVCHDPVFRGMCATTPKRPRPARGARVPPPRRAGHVCHYPQKGPRLPALLGQAAGWPDCQTAATRGTPGR